VPAFGEKEFTLHVVMKRRDNSGFVCLTFFGFRKGRNSVEAVFIHNKSWEYIRGFVAPMHILFIVKERLWQLSVRSCDQLLCSQPLSVQRAPGVGHWLSLLFSVTSVYVTTRRLSYVRAKSYTVALAHTGWKFSTSLEREEFLNGKFDGCGTGR
jgi:hypothetical protein